MVYSLCTCRHASTCKPFQPVTGPHVWYSSEYQDIESFSYTLTPSDLEELTAAIAQVKQSGLDLKVSLTDVYACADFACLDFQPGPL